MILMRTRVIALGDANVDLIASAESLPARGEEILIRNLEMHAGGSAANLAVAVSRLGVRSGFIGKVGDDLFGHFLIKHFRREGVNISQLRISDEAPTGLVFCIITNDGERTMFTSRGVNVNLSPDEIDVEYIKGADVLHLSGYALLKDPQRSAALKALEAAKEGKLFISFDVGVLAPMEVGNLARSISGSVNLLFLNELEAKWLTGASPRSAAEKLLKLGLEIVALKLGSKGCLVLTKEDRISVPAFVVKTVNSTGAGDAFNAGFLVGFMEGWNLEEIARFANAAGAIKVTRVGAASALPTRREIEAFMKRRV